MKITKKKQEDKVTSSYIKFETDIAKHQSRTIIRRSNN